MTPHFAPRLPERHNRKRNGNKWEKHALLHILRNPLYVGKLRWREVIYEGNHEAIVSSELFENAQNVLKERAEELNGRLWHNGDERLLSGIIKCVKCRGHMVGVSTRKNGRKIPYYLCSKRWKTHDCEQDYVRADLLEAAIVQDVKAMFRDEQFMARIWVEANKRLDTEKPDVEREIEKVDGQMDRVRKGVDRYFRAFETGALKAATCGEKVEELKARLAELEAERAQLESRRKSLDLPAMDREMLARLVDEFEQVMAEGTNPQKKHLLQRVVKKVLIHDRRTVEVWYGLPNSPSVRTPEYLAPRRVRAADEAADRIVGVVLALPERVPSRNEPSRPRAPPKSTSRLKTRPACPHWPTLLPVRGRTQTGRPCPCGHGRMAGAGVARYAFTVRLSHSLLHAS